MRGGRSAVGCACNQEWISGGVRGFPSLGGAGVASGGEVPQGHRQEDCGTFVVDVECYLLPTRLTSSTDSSFIASQEASHSLMTTREGCSSQASARHISSSVSSQTRSSGAETQEEAVRQSRVTSVQKVADCRYSRSRRAFLGLTQIS